jgi:hypothetical protein
MNGARGKQKTKNPVTNWVLSGPELFLVFNWSLVGYFVSAGNFASTSFTASL